MTLCARSDRISESSGLPVRAVKTAAFAVSSALSTCRDARETAPCEVEVSLRRQGGSAALDTHSCLDHLLLADFGGPSALTCLQSAGRIYRMLMEREMIRLMATSETIDCRPMMLFAVGVSGIVSVGLNAVALVSDT